MGTRRSAALALFAFISFFGFCQTKVSTPVPVDAAKAEDYSQEGVVIEHYATKVAFEPDGSSVREVSVTAKVQADAGVQQLAVLTMPYTSSTESVEVDYVRVRKTDGTVVVTPPYNIQDMPAGVTRIAPMYSDIHEKHITVKALGVGDTLEYLIRFRTTKPEIRDQFWFAHNFIKEGICKDEVLEISVPKDKYVSVSNGELKPALRDENNRKIYTWKSSNLVNNEKDKKELPRRESPRPDVELTTFHGWDEVGAWYAALQKDQLTVTPEIQKKASEITKGLTTEDEKTHALYDYVATHFHYVSLSFGIGRYQPHAADEVLGNEYGDCKDKHTLLATMLKAVGIDAWPALINSSRKIDTDLPAPSSFDHVITVVPRGDRTIWLDTTSEVAPFGLLLSGLRGKQALVVPTGKPALLMKSPENMPFPFVENFSAEGKLSADGVFTGHMTRIARGDSEVIMRLGYRRVPRAQWKELTQRISYLSNFGGDVSEVKATTPEDTAKPFEVSYDYTRKNYSDWDNRRITPPLPPFGIEAASNDERKPVEPFLLGAVGEMKYFAKIELPSFARATAPANVDVLDDFAEYHAHYTLEKGVLTCDRRLVIKKPEIAVADWDRWVKFRKAVSDDEDHYIDLNEASTSAALPNFDDSEAGRKYQEALTAMRNRDLTKATDLLRKAIELDPKCQGAHATLGWIYFSQNRREEGLAEVKKEEELNPKFAGSYRTLAWMYGVMQHPDDAANEWRQLLKIEPDNRDALTSLTRLLLASKKYSDAIAVLEPAVKSAADSETLKLLLANAYLKNNQKKEGLAILQNAVSDNTDATTLNDVAYQMADADVDLETARNLSEKSLRLIGEMSGKTPVADITALPFTISVTAYWDTLGWIYYRMNQYEKAAEYLKPAWLLSQDPVIGDHLAQVYRKQNKVKDAQQTWELALAANLRSPDLRNEIRDHYKEMTGKYPGETVSTHRLPDGTWSATPAEQLSRMRTFKIPVSSPPNGSATFGFAYSQGKVEEIAYVDGSPELKPFAEKLKSSKLDIQFPNDGISLKLVRRGILLCHSGTCDLTFLLPENAFINQVPGG